MKIDNETRLILQSFLNSVRGLEEKEKSSIIRIVEHFWDETQTKETVQKATIELEHLGSHSKIFSSKEAYFILGLCHERSLCVDHTLAAKFYVEAAKHKNAWAQYKLGYCHHYGLGVPKLPKKAIEFYEKSASQGNAHAMNQLGYCYHQGFGVTQDPKRAAEYYQEAAERGNATAQCNLGYCYQRGFGVNQDLKRAAELYEQSASQGNSDAHYNLARCLEQGLGVPIDRKQAVEFYQLAGKQGNISALCRLGYCYNHGIGVPQDYRLATMHYRRAAQSGNAEALYRLGVCYSQGTGVPRDLEQATALYMKAAKSNNADGLYELGFCIEKGIGIPQSPHWHKLAVENYKKAATLGHTIAEYRLGLCYESGLGGIEKNPKLAVKFYQKAANKGYAPALWSLGVCYERGQGVLQDISHAATLYQQAIEEGCEDAKLSLAVCYRNGKGVSKDLNRAILLLHFTTDRKPEWDVFLKELHSLVPKVPVTLEHMIKHYKDIESTNDPIGQSSLGFCYQLGIGVGRDLNMSMDFYTQAFDNEEARCFRDIGYLYQMGVRKYIDIHTIIKHSQKLVMEGKNATDRREALLLLGYIYEQGAPGLDLSFFKALDYYQLADGMALDDETGAFVKSKTKEFLPLLQLRNVVQKTNFLPDGQLVSLVAEYAAELPRLSRYQDLNKDSRL